MLGLPLQYVLLLMLLPLQPLTAAAAAGTATADYAAFDVDVTTADPGDAALEGIGQRAVIGGAAGDWYGVAGGIAFVNSFGKRGLPCFIFSLSLGPNNPKVRHQMRLQIQRVWLQQCRVSSSRSAWGQTTPR